MCPPNKCNLVIQIAGRQVTVAGHAADAHVLFVSRLINSTYLAVINYMYWRAAPYVPTGEFADSRFISWPIVYGDDRQR